MQGGSIRSEMAAVRKTTLRLQLSEPATPARVAAVASFVDRMIAATHPHLREGDVTLEIANYSTKAAVHARTAEARSALQLAFRFLENPVKTMQRQPAQARELAEVLAAAGDTLAGAQFMRTPRKTIATIDESFVKMMRGIARSARPPAMLRGPTTIDTPILRVGRTDEGKRPAIRVHVLGGTHDLRVKDGVALGPFFDAAKAGATYRVKLDARWSPDAQGKPRLEVARTRAVSVQRLEQPISGRAFVEQVSAELPDVFEDVEATLAEIEGR